MKVGDRVQLVSMKEIELEAAKPFKPRPVVKMGDYGRVIHVGFDGLMEVKFDSRSEYAHSDVIICSDSMVERVPLGAEKGGY